MVQVYYRTNAAIEKKPVCFAPSDEGLLKDDYELVYEVPTEMAPFPLEEVFRMMNVVDGDEVPVKLGVRSMMPGDVVVDEVGDVWFCGGAGWEQVFWD